jgi:hypothetical protein
LQGLSQEAFSQFNSNEGFASRINNANYADINRRQDITVAAAGLSRLGVKADIIEKFNKSANLFADAILKGERESIRFDLDTERQSLLDAKSAFDFRASGRIAESEDSAFEGKMQTMLRTADPKLAKEAAFAVDSMRGARRADRQEVNLRVDQMAGIVQKARSNSFAASMMSIDEEERQTLQETDDEGDFAVRDLYDQQRKTVRGQRRRYIASLEGDVEETSLLAQRKPGSAAITGLFNDINERANQQGVGQKEKSLIYESGANLLRAQLQDIMERGRGEETNQFAAFGAQDTGQESVPELIKLTNNLLTQILQKSGAGVR